jgi:D-alanine--poly(phosphoribitol) ligase subunit 2
MSMLDQVLEYIRTEFAPKSKLNPDTNLFCEGLLDSTAMLELILWVGDTFHVTVQNEDLSPENFGTPRNIVEYVERHVESSLEVERNAASRIAS